MFSRGLSPCSPESGVLRADFLALRLRNGDADPGVLLRFAHLRVADAAHRFEAKAMAGELADLRAELEFLRLSLRLVRLRAEYKANFDPNQPRDDDGRWTDGGGEAPDGTAIVFAGDRRVVREPVDLREEEANGGHTIARHVNMNPKALIENVFRSIAADPDPRRHDIRSGSFPSLDAANRLVNSTIEQNRSVVEAIAMGLLPEQRVESYFSSPTGIEAYAQTVRSRPVIRDAFGVGVYIRRDISSPRGYRVISAYPRNRY